MEKKDKPSIGLIIAMNSKDKMKDMKGGKSEYKEDMYGEMAGDLLKAIEKKDAKMLGMYLKDFIKACLHKMKGE